MNLGKPHVVLKIFERILGYPMIDLHRTKFGKHPVQMAAYQLGICNNNSFKILSVMCGFPKLGHI